MLGFAPEHNTLFELSSRAWLPTEAVLQQHCSYTSAGEVHPSLAPAPQTAFIPDRLHYNGLALDLVRTCLLLFGSDPDLTSLIDTGGISLQRDCLVSGTPGCPGGSPTCPSPCLGLLAESLPCQPPRGSPVTPSSLTHGAVPVESKTST